MKAKTHHAYRLPDGEIIFLTAGADHPWTDDHGTPRPVVSFTKKGGEVVDAVLVTGTDALVADRVRDAAGNVTPVGIPHGRLATIGALPTKTPSRVRPYRVLSLVRTSLVAQVAALSAKYHFGIEFDQITEADMDAAARNIAQAALGAMDEEV